MFKLTWKIWLAVLLGIALVFGGLFFMFNAQGEPGIAYWLGALGAAVGGVWALLALVKWREISWVKRVNSFVIATFGFGLLILLFRAVDWEPGWTTSLYCYFAVVGFLLGINVLRLVLQPGHPVLGVARTMLEESLRMGVALIFIIAMLVFLVLLPLILGSEDRVTYMVQRFLTYSIMIVSVLLGLMTVLLSARSVSLEIASRQVHMTLTKPLGRAQYLAGKWLGVVLLNAVLLAVAGIAIYGFTMGIARNPALNALDRYAVDREILTARLAQSPGPVGTTWNRMYANVLKEKQLTDPDRFGAEGTPFATLAGDAKQEVVSDTVSRFYSVAGGSSQDYVISGLNEAAAAAERAAIEGQDLLVADAGLTRDQAKQYVDYAMGRPSDLEAETASKVPASVRDAVMRVIEREVIQLSLTPAASPKPENLNIELLIEINGQPWPMPQTPTGTPPRQRMVVEIPNEVPVPAGLVSKDGTMVLTIKVPDRRNDGVEQQAVRFNYKDAVIEVFYRVGTFEGNLTRAMVIIWLKLAFLAMVGLMAGSLLSFPVAAMLALVIYVAAAAGGVINESLAGYASIARDDSTWQVITGTIGKFFSHLANGELYDAFRLILRFIGTTFMLLMPSFGEFNTHQPLSDGHVISNATVGKAAWKIGLLWTGVVAIIGLFLFNRKEIARVQV